MPFLSQQSIDHKLIMDIAHQTRPFFGRHRTLCMSAVVEGIVVGALQRHLQWWQVHRYRVRRQESDALRSHFLNAEHWQVGAFPRTLIKTRTCSLETFSGARRIRRAVIFYILYILSTESPASAVMWLELMLMWVEMLQLHDCRCPCRRQWRG